MLRLVYVQLYKWPHMQLSSNPIFFRLTLTRIWYTETNLMHQALAVEKYQFSVSLLLSRSSFISHFFSRSLIGLRLEYLWSQCVYEFRHTCVLNEQSENKRRKICRHTHNGNDSVASLQSKWRESNACTYNEAILKMLNCVYCTDMSNRTRNFYGFTSEYFGVIFFCYHCYCCSSLIYQECCGSVCVCAPHENRLKIIITSLSLILL